jgi:rRNA-processing protein FCF1
MENYYDIIIVGSGVAGLYSAYNILNINPKTSLLILEQYKKKWIGGRWGNEQFHGSSIVTGAGIGRFKKDYLLKQLIRELKIPVTTYETKQYYSFDNPININKIMDYLRGEYNKLETKPRITFKEFAKKYLKEESYNLFLITAGYTDYEKEDVHDVLFDYGMDDNMGKWKAINIPWKKMVHALVSKIGSNKIKTSSKVVKIKQIENEKNQDTCIFKIILESGIYYFCNKVIIATPIDGILKLVPGANLINSPYHQIKGQPFIRLYGKFSKQSIPILKEYILGYTVVTGPLQKIIPVDADKGIYMIAYCDNNNALLLKKYIENTENNRKYIASLLEKSVDIPNGSIQLLDMKDFYWPIGTHYYTPLSKQFKSRKEFLNVIQHPEPGILVVGEAVSDDQGWSEGALRSVKAVLTKKWMKEECNK